MKNKKTLLGVAATAVVATTLLLFPASKSGSYSLRTNTITENQQGYQGAFDYYNQIKMNLETGIVNKEDWLRAKQEAELLIANTRADIGWKEHGPDNVGGRTRAILVDKDNIYHVFAGSVSGGLFESKNRGNTWNRVMGFDENLGISSMCMTDNGTIYVATGHSQEQTGGTTAGYDSGANGNGVYKSTDGGVTFSSVVGTENYNWVNEVVAKGNDVFIACNLGLRKLSGTTISNITLGSGSTSALSISNDGTLIVASSGSNKTYVSTNGGSSFTNVSGSIIQGKIPQGAGRIEYAISHEKLNGKFVIYASQANSNLKGIFKSIDNGVTWTQIAPANSSNTPGAFAPFNSGGSGQGLYDNIITVVKGNPNAILLGGINVYAKSSTGNWEQRSNGFFAQQSPLYVHSDQHEMQWDSEGRLWLGNDGGVFFSDDNGNSFHEADRGYNVTQFYKIGASAHGDVIGGAQDNGTQANYHNNATYREHDAVGGGDGFGCAMSFINRDILFSSVYYGAVNRSGDRGVTSTAFNASNIPATYGTPGDLTGNGLGSFNTCIELYENPNDLNSTDSIKVTPTQGYSAGEVIVVNSTTSGATIDYTLPNDVLFSDTLFFDPSQTTQDTVVTDTVSGVSYNVNIFGYSFAFGGPTIDVGDTLIINGLPVPVHIDDVSTDHYWGTNPARPGRLIDLVEEPYITNVTWDTLMVQDPYQSWFAFGLGNGKGVWLTRNALRLSASHDGFLLGADGLVGNVSTMEFSADGNHLFIGTTAGRLYRLSGLDDIYSPNPNVSNSPPNIKDSLLAFDNGHYSTTFDEITGSFGGAYITNIASDKSNPDHLIVSLGNYGGSADKVQESTNATGAAVTYSGIDGNANNGGLPNAAPVYSCVIDRNDPNIILIGTDFGVFRTTNSNGGSTQWENVSGGFGNVPVWDMVQNWRTFNEGCYKPGEIYIGTHGRGIWSTDEYLGVQEVQDNLNDNKFKSNIIVYPNPVVDYGTISFNLDTNSDVNIMVFSLTGKLVKNITKQNMSKGENSITIPTDELSKGTYIVRLKAGEMIETSKFIKH